MYNFSLETPKGAASLMSNLYYLKSAAYDKSDFNAVDILIDFKSIFEKVKFTKRQKQALDLVFFKGYTQTEAGQKLGISQQAVAQTIKASTQKISDKYAMEYEKVKLRGNLSENITSSN